MDQKLFEQRLTEVCDWIRVNDQVEDLLKRNKLSIEDAQDLTEALSEKSQGHIKILKIHQPDTCPDCDKTCAGGRILEHKNQAYKKGRTQWITKCTVCRYIRNDTTGQYEPASWARPKPEITVTEQRRRNYESYCRELAKKYGIDIE